MRRIWNHWRLAGLALLGLTGCVHNSQPDLRPERPEDYSLPPANMYNKPPDIPKEYMNQVPGRKETNLDELPPPGSSGAPKMGMGPGR